MTLTINSSHLRIASSALRRLRSGATLPILDHIRLTVAEGEPEAVLESTNLDISLAIRIPIGGPTTPGSFTVPRAEFFGLASRSDKDTPVRFDCTPGKGTYPVDVIHFAKGLRSTRSFLGFFPDEFPDPPAIAGRPVIFPREALSALARVRSCVSKDETRYVLNGAFITPHMGGCVVATDGRRMAYVPARIFTKDSIIPTAVIDMLADPSFQAAATWAADEENEAAVLTFKAPPLISVRLSFRLIAGNFPSYRAVMPTAHNGSATFPASVVPGFLAWLRPLKDATVSLALSGSIAQITARARDEQTTTTLPVHLAGDPPPQVNYNAAFLADGLAMNLHTIDLIDEMSPGVLTDGLTRYVLMPMRSIAPSEPTDPSDESDPSEESEEVEEAEESPQPVEA